MDDLKRLLSEGCSDPTDVRGLVGAMTLAVPLKVVRLSVFVNSKQGMPIVQVALSLDPAHWTSEMASVTLW